MTNLTTCIATLRKHPHIVNKNEIARTYENLGDTVAPGKYSGKQNKKIRLGDDTAAIMQEDGSYLLFASEGIISDFLENDPWFAGYSAIMVNISDICAMGGLPMAVTDTIYTMDAEQSKEVWNGMLAASKAYNVPIVGGHTCYDSKQQSLSVAIVGKATESLLTSFDAQPEECILLAMDMNGSYYKDYPFWNSSTTSEEKKLQENLTLLYRIANEKLAACCKDVSMGGIIGTLLMLLHTAKVGAQINLEDIQKPNNVSWEKWLSSFPSYGYLLTCSKKNAKSIQSIFKENAISCQIIGEVTDSQELWLKYEQENIKF